MGIKWIKHEQIEVWADRQSAQALLPKLIAKLILATNNTVEKLYFPHDNAVNLSGFDGVCKCKYSSLFVPEGDSIWEIGTDKEYFSKYQHDIKKRTKDTGNFKKQNTSFVFVTPRMWKKKEGKGKEDFVESEVNKYDWKDIRIIDSLDIEQWLELAPSVAVGFAEEIGYSVNNLMSAEKYYESYAKTIKGILPPSFFIGERANNLSELKQYIESNSDKKSCDYYIKCDSISEGILTFIAYLKENKYNDLLNKIVVVLGSNGLHNLSLFSKSDYIAVIGYSYKEADQQYWANQTHVIPTVDINDQHLNKDCFTIELPHLSDNSLIKSLCCIGYNKIEAKQLINSVNSCIHTLLKKISNNPCLSLSNHILTNIENIRFLLPAIIVNKWSDDNICDRKLLSLLSSSDYGIYRNKLDSLFPRNDSCITSNENGYWCYSDEEIWVALNKFIHIDLIENLKKLLKDDFIEYLATDDVIFNDKNMYSPGLIRGIIHSVFMLRNLIKDNKLTNIDTNTFNADRIIHEILEKAYLNSKWNNIEHWLSELAEAAPKGFLDFFEKNLSRNDFKNFLNDVNNYHIIWALERLSQIEESSKRAILLLIKMSDYNGSAAESLSECLCLWYSQSAIDLEDKKHLIKKIVQSDLNSRLQMIEFWLDDFKSVTVHQNPKWAKTKMEIGPVPVEEYQSLRRYVAEVFVDNLDSSLECWKIIIEHSDCFHDYEKMLIQKFNEFVKQMKFSEKIEIYKKVLLEIYLKSKSNNLQNQNTELLSKIYSILYDFEDVRLVGYYYTKIKLSYPVIDDAEKFNKLRLSELSRYFCNHDIVTFMGIISHFEDTFSFINDFSNLIKTGVISPDFIFEIKSKDEYMARRIVGCIYRIDSSVIDLIITKNKAEKIWLLSCLPLNKNTLNMIVNETVDMQNYYWQHVDIIYESYNDVEFLMQCCKGLIKNGRLKDVAISLACSEVKTYKFLKRILDDLIDFLKRNMPYKNFQNRRLGYDFENFFIHIEPDDNNELLELANWECKLLPYFRDYYSLEFIPRAIIIMPDFYIKLIENGYKFIRHDVVFLNLSNEEQLSCQIASDVLFRISELGKKFDIYKDNNWLNTVENLAYKNNLLEANTYYLSHILANSPADKDGAWPCHLLEEFIERQSDDFLEILKENKYNYAELLKVDYGVSKNKNADEFALHANNIEIDYPRLAKLLRELSEHYRSDAAEEKEFVKRHDEYYGY